MPFLIPVAAAIGAGLAAATPYLTALSAVAAVGSGAVSIMAGKEQAKQANAAARAEEDAARTEAILRKNELSRIQGTIVANFGAMGTDAYTGSAFSLLKSNERMSDIDIGLNAKGRSQRAFQLRSSGKNAKTSGILSGVGSFVNAASQFGDAGSQYLVMNPPKPKP